MRDEYDPVKLSGGARFAEPNGSRAETIPGAAITEDYDLPDLGGTYKAHARASNKPVYTLHCLKGREGIFSYQYVHMDSNARFQATDKGQQITIRFAGLKPVELIIRGRNLWRFYDYLFQHRMPWVMQADRDMAQDREPVVTAIEIRELTREE